jgi:hypothetical protein
LYIPYEKNAVKITNTKDPVDELKDEINATGIMNNTNPINN